MSNISHHIALQTLLICTTAALCLGSITAGQDTDTTQTLDQVFPRDRVLQIDITLDKDDWNEIRKQSRSLATALGPDRQFETIESPFSYVPADITIDGVLYQNVGLRKKGFLGSLDRRRPSLKVKLDKNAKGTTIEGLSSLTLNNNKQDTTLMSQFIGYDLFKTAGTPAPRASLAKVSVNGENLGVYSHIESLRKPFLANSFGNPNGTLYEGTVVDFYEDWAGGFERKFGPKKTGLAQLQALINALEIEDDAEAEEAIWKVVDQDAFYKFWAMEGLLSFWDGYAGNRNNFFVYHNPETHKLHFIPWGADAMFETYSKLGEDPASPRSVRTVGRLAYRLYQIPSARERYAQTMQQLLTDVWHEETILADIDRVEAMSRAHLSAAQKSSFDPDRIREFVRNRRAMIEPEITGIDMPLWAQLPEPPPIIGGKQSPDESLFAAAKLGDVDAIKTHLDQGTDVNARDEGGGSALGLAAIAGQIDAMRYLIEHGAEVNATSNDGGVPLHGAAFFGEYDAVELLLTSGADPNIINNDGYTPTDITAAPWNDEMQDIAEFWSGWLGLSTDMEQVKASRPKVALLLAEHGGKYSILLPKPARPLLSSAAKDGDIAALKKDIDAGADVNRLDEKGISPLAWAAVMGQDDAVTLLLEANADINRRNADGGTPLHAAAFFGHANTVTLLLAKGADRNIRNNSGQTALETMASGWNEQMRGVVEYIAYLLSIKVDPEAIGQAWPGIIQQLRTTGQ
ncbi:MAG: CotH kinase family protein [Phycisphaerales bacterium]|nr:CotH kinase family protein [Phycisphaerales bacterium]